jgi:penicillin-binding protein 1C
MIFLVRNPAHGLRWRVNTQRLEAEGGQASWTPIPGRHRVVLVNMLGTELDAVDFEVREVQPDSQPAQEESGEQ